MPTCNTRSVWRYCRLLAGCWLLLWAMQAQAAITVEVADGEVRLPAGNTWMDYHDPGVHNINPEQVRGLPEIAWRGVQHLPLHLALGIRQTLWLRLQVANRGQQNETLVLENLNPMTDHFELYLHDGQHWLATEPVMPSVHGSHASRFMLGPGQQATLFLRNTGFHSSIEPMSLQTLDTFRQQKYRLHLIAGVFDGIFLGLTLYSLLLAIKTRQRMYVAYCALGLSSLLATVSHQNLLPAELVRDHGALLTNLRIIGPLLSFAALAYFVQVFLASARFHPRLDRYLSGYIVCMLLIIVAFLNGIPSLVTTPAFALATTAALVIMLYLCLTDTRHWRITMALTGLALLMPTAGGIFTALSTSSVIDISRHYVLSMQGGSAMMVILLALAMIMRLRQLQDEQQRQIQSAVAAGIVSDAQNRLLAHLNHELRTPLNGILGAAEILLHKSAPRDRQIFNMIHQTALPLKHLVDDMVNLDAISDRRKTIQHVRFDLQTLLQECTDLFLPMAHAKRIRLFSHIDNDVATDVSGDPNRLRQILLNLIGNACKFTHDGEVGVHVSRRLRPKQDAALYHFEVTDSGMGISQADEQRLFQSFETGNPTSNPQGTGLGLSIVRELSELLGGSCGYSNSQQQAGSQFWFTAALEPHQSVQRKTHRAFENLHILLADESRLLCEHMTRQLAGTAREIVSASTTREITAALRQAPCDLAIIHQTLLDDTCRSACSAGQVLLVPYLDQSEMLDTTTDAGMPSDKLLVRRSSIEKFSLQVAEQLMRKQRLYSAGPGAAGQSSRHQRILVAEDILTNQHVIREMLLSLSAQPVLCNNGREAFERYLENLLDGKPFDAILMDCEMPVMDGFEATRQIRQYEQENSLAPVTIIALTAHTEPAYRERSAAAGMDLYLTKPVTVDTLRQCLFGKEGL